jgi:Na+-driven multidrug efflux pump
MGPSRTSRYRHGVATGYIFIVLSGLTNLWFTSFALNYLSREEYGLFVLSNDLLLWLGILDFGMTGGLRASLAQITGRPEPHTVNRLVSTTFFTQLGVASAILLGGIVMSWLAPTFFDLRENLRGTASAVLLVLTLGAAISFATQSFSSVLVAYQQIHVDNIFRIIVLCVRMIIGTALLLAGWKVMSLALAGLSGVVLMSVFAVARCYITIPDVRVRKSLASRELLWSMSKNLNIWLGLSSGAGVIIQYSDRLVAAKVISLSAVTTISLTERVYLLASLLVIPLITTANPAMGQLVGSGQKKKAFLTYKRLLLLSSGLGITFALALWSGNSVFVNRWVGVDNYGGRWLDLALMLSFLVTVWLTPSRMALFVSLQAKPLALTRIVEAGLNIALSVVFAYQFGIVGIPAATVVAALATSAWYLPLVIARYFTHARSMVFSGITRPLLIPIAIVVPTAIFMRVFASMERGYVGAAVAVGAVGVVGGTALWRFTFDDSVREKLLDSLILPRFLRMWIRRSATET